MCDSSRSSNTSFVSDCSQPLGVHSSAWYEANLPIAHAVAYAISAVSHVPLGPLVAVRMAPLRPTTSYVTLIVDPPRDRAKS